MCYVVDVGAVDYGDVVCVVGVTGVGYVNGVDYVDMNVCAVVTCDCVDCVVVWCYR